MVKFRTLKDIMFDKNIINDNLEVVIKYKNATFYDFISRSSFRRRKHKKTDEYELDLNDETKYRIVNDYTLYIDYSDKNYMYSKENFHKGTFANWKKVNAPEREPDYQSEYSSSVYWYSEEGVYRMSDHWGYDIRSCDWLLEGSWYAGDAVVGFCKWEHFVQRETEFDCNKGFTGKSFEYYKEKYSL